MFDKADFDFSSEEDFQKPTNGDVLKNKTIKTDSSMIYRIYKENSGYDTRYEFKLKDQKMGFNLLFLCELLERYITVEDAIRFQSI